MKTVLTQCGSCSCEFLLEVEDTDWADHDGEAMCPMCVDHWSTIQKPLKPVDEPKVIQQLRGIKEKGLGGVEENGEKVLVDSFTASAILAVYDAVNEKNKIMLAGFSISKMSSVCFKLIHKHQKV